jgi:signal transduction histidine kinase
MSDSDHLRASRARLAAAAIADRRRFERALHDGVQQDLIALTVGLQLLQERIGDRAGAHEAIEDLRAAARDALERVRVLADEIYPSVLDARGLAGAPRRYPPEVEAAVSLCSPTVICEEHGRLVVELPDDPRARDLLEAVGAQLTVEPGRLRAEFAL